MIVLLFLFSFLGPVIYQKWGESTVDRSSTVKVLETPHTWTDEEGNKIQVIEELTIITEINSYADPSKDHFLGTDDKGMDVFVRLMYGGRISLTIGTGLPLLDWYCEKRIFLSSEITVALRVVEPASIPIYALPV